MSQDLRSKTIRAIGHLGVGGALGKIVSLGSTLIMARLLSPEDYGLMAMAMVLVGFVGFFNEVGIGAALVQKTDLSPTEINGCFSFSILASLLLFAVTALLSVPAADFFGNPRLQPMIVVLAITFILGAVGTVPMALLRREMRFKAIAGITISGVFVQSGLALLLAWLGHGPWSLVWSFVASTLFQSVLTFYLSRWRPSSLRGLHEAFGLVRYGLQVTMTRIFWYLYSNADKVVIGRMLGDRPLGIYDMAYSLATLPTSQITSLATNVSSPLFARLQHDRIQLQAYILHFTRGVAYVTYPALIGMLMCSHELIAVMLGDKWAAMLVPFGALCLMGLVKSVDPLLSQVLIATGHARQLTGYTLLCGITMTAAIIAGASLDGLHGVSIAWVVVYPLLSIRLLYLVSNVTGLPMYAYYRCLVPVISATAAMALVIFGLRAGLVELGTPVLLLLIIQIAVGAMVYIGWIIGFDRQGLGQIRQVLIDLGISEQRLARWPFNRSVIPVTEAKS